MHDRFWQSWACCDFAFAAWARHEGKGDSQDAPSVLKELNYAARMEGMATRKMRIRLAFKIICEANRT